MFDFIAAPMGQVLKLLYDMAAFQNYGVAIILFTLFIKTLMLPLAVRQHRSALQMRTFQPQIKMLQDKYKNDQQKLNIKMTKMYKENKINPVGGCLPLLVQMPILFALYSVFSRPLTFMYGLPGDVIDRLFQDIPVIYQNISGTKDMSILSYFSNHPDALANATGLLSGSGMPNMLFLGFNLSAVPSHIFASGTLLPGSLGDYALLLFPLLAFATAWAATKTSGQNMAEASGSAAIAKSPSQMMSLVSPVMSGVITMTMPAGLGLYWIMGNIYQLAQDLFLNRFFQRREQG